MQRWIPRFLWMLAGMLAVWIWQHPGLPGLDAHAQARIIAPAQAPRSGSEPLSADESSRALRVAQAAQLPTATRRRLAALLVERHDGGKQSMPRAADVYLYDYASDALWLLTVDLTSSQVLTTAQLPHTQPPPTPAELQTALRLLLDHPAARKAVEQSLGGPATPELLRVSGISLSPDATMTRQLPDCERHRCVQLLLDTLDGRGINLAPVIDLSALRVVKEQ